jgi:hypothetical protein
MQHEPDAALDDFLSELLAIDEAARYVQERATIEAELHAQFKALQAQNRAAIQEITAELRRLRRERRSAERQLLQRRRRLGLEPRPAPRASRQRTSPRQDPALAAGQASLRELQQSQAYLQAVRAQMRSHGEQQQRMVATTYKLLSELWSERPSRDLAGAEPVVLPASACVSGGSARTDAGGDECVQRTPFPAR